MQTRGSDEFPSLSELNSAKKQNQTTKDLKAQFASPDHINDKKSNFSATQN